MLRIRLDINGRAIGWLECVRQPGGPDDGWNTYVCNCGALPGQPFEVRHNRSEGAWALASSAAAVLADAGVGAVTPLIRLATRSEEGVSDE
jgi:hypothetical protein